MSEPSQTNRPAEPVNPYAGTPTWQGPPQGAPEPGDPWAQPPAWIPPEHPQSATVLLLGVLGLFSVVTAPFALVIGMRARAEVAAGHYAPSTRLTIGWALGLAVTLGALVGLLLLGGGA